MSYESPYKLSAARRWHLSEVFRLITEMRAARADFGFERPEHFESVSLALEAGDVTPEEIRALSGDGPALTALLRACPHNPHKDVTFETAFDAILRPETTLKK